MKNVAFIGLGVMGYPMAGHLANAGHPTQVFNRSEAKAQAWSKEYAGTACQTPKQASTGRDIVFICVGNDQDVRSVFYGEDGVLAGVAPGTIIVDHTTTSAELAEELAKACQDVGVQFIDAPVSGGQAGAENGVLTVMCGGEPASFELIKPVVASYAKQIKLMGPHGQGQRCKMVNQICIAGILQGLSEAIQLAKSCDLDVEQVVEVIKHGAAGSWQMENRANTMAANKFDFGFAIDWMRKDLGFCLDQANNNGLQLPLVEAVDQRYQQLQQQGHGRLDTSALILSYQ